VHNTVRKIVAAFISISPSRFKQRQMGGGVRTTQTGLDFVLSLVKSEHKIPGDKGILHPKSKEPQ
jgi:hypothetical protein